MKVFISHSSLDKKFVRTLKTDLNENGFDTFVDEDSLEIGDSLIEKLEMAIQESSHFLIVLSVNALKSPWVKEELNQALALMKGKLIKKILPIKYRTCDIPKELSNLIYADLSNEVVQTEGDKIKFLGDGYSKVLPSLIKTLRSSEKELSASDKTILINEVSEIENKIEQENYEKIKTKHKFIGYADEHWYSFYQNKVYATGKFKDIYESDIRPIVLPSIYKGIFKGLKTGDKIKFVANDSKILEGEFCTYRLKDNSIAIPNELKDELNIHSGQDYNIMIDQAERMIEIL